MFYAFLQKEGKNYYKIYSIDFFDEELAKTLKLDNHDLALPISEQAKYFYEKAMQDGYYVLLKRDLKNLIKIEDFIIFRNSEDIVDKIKEENPEIEDEDIKNEMFFNDKKTEYLKEFQSKIFPKVSFFDLAALYSCIIDWSELFSKGFAITDDNKEDVFIEIIEKDDDKLLNILERYLQEREDFEVFRKLLIKFYKIRDELDFMSYWDYDSIEEAIEDLDKKYAEFKKEIEGELINVEEKKKEDLALFYKLKQEFEKKKQKEA